MPERDQISPRPDIPLGRYRHYKGGEYEVIALACDEATHEWLVVYRALYDTGDMPDRWCRIVDDFLGCVIVDGKSVPRFEKK